jgi:toxin ParE1/3/4
MAKFKFSEEAYWDLNDILNYTFDHWSENQAEKYYKTLKKACEFIAKNQSLGRNYSNVRKHLKGYKAGRHIIFFEIINDDEIKVQRILHERSNIKNILAEK